MPEQEKIEELTDSVKEYVNTNCQLIRLQAAEKFSVIVSGILSRLIVGLVVFLFLFFISLWAGYYISACFGNNYSGFPIVAGFYLLTCFILVIGRRKLLVKPIRNSIIRKVLSKN